MTAQRRRRAFWVAALMVLAGVALGGYAVGSRVQSAAQAAAVAEAPPETVLTEPVRQGPMKKTVVFRGAAGAQFLASLKPDSAAAGDLPVVTAMGIGVGVVVHEGDRLYEVAGRPTVLLVGQFPMYRDLSLGDTGPDVVQLASALHRLGLTGQTSSRTLDKAMVRGFGLLLRSHGYARALDDPIRRSDVTFLKRAPVNVERVGFGLGSVLDDEADFTVRAGRVIVKGSVPEADAKFLAEGGAVEVVDDVTGSTATGTVARVGRTVRDDRTGAPVRRIRVRMPAGYMPQSSEVRVIAGGVVAGRSVLSVPVTAVRTTAEGGAVVTVLRAGQPVAVAVRTGVSADGWVSVDSADLSAGDPVVVSRGGL